jgi:hypothetical protein
VPSPVEGFPGQGVVYASPAAAGLPQAQGGVVQAQPVQVQPVPQQVRPGAPVAEKRDAAQRAFHMYDTDRSGAIDMNEFANALTYLGLSISRDDAAAIFCVIDTDGNGTVSMSEFIEHYIANY